MHKIRVVVLVAMLALVLTVAPPVGQTVVHATPVTLSETLDGLPAEPAAAQPRSSASTQPAPTSRSLPVETPLTFNMVGIAAPESATAVRLRSSEDGLAWSHWEQLDFLDAEDGPDADTEEYRRAEQFQRGRQPTHPVWVGEADHVQVEVDGAEVGDLEVTLIDAMGSNDGPVRRTYETRTHAEAEASSVPNVITRSQWGADESLRNSGPSYSRQVHLGVVHHTAHTSGSSANTYSADAAAGIMRAMYRYHTRSLGWSDLGYNVVIDRFGRVYEGRYGGLTRNVIGAHARGHNTGSFGVSVIGNFVNANPPQAALDALAQVIGWRSAMHGIDPNGWTNQMADGRWRPTIVGHRDVGQTSCPGRIQGHLPNLRQQAAGFWVPFPDVPHDSPHRPAILELADAGVTQGCRENNFCPFDFLTRDQAASFVVRAFELEPIPGQRFPDVPATNVHAGAVNALAELGWILGREDGTFAPREHLTRGQLASVLARSLNELGSTLEPLEEELEELEDLVDESEELSEEIGVLAEVAPPGPPYPDVAVTHVHAPGIAALLAVGVVGNCGNGNFCPDADVRRDSTASFVNMVRRVHLEARTTSTPVSAEPPSSAGQPTSPDQP